MSSGFPSFPDVLIIALADAKEFIPKIKSGVFGILGIIHIVVLMGFEYGDKYMSISKFPSDFIVSPEALMSSCGLSNFHLLFGRIFCNNVSCIHDMSAP